MTLLEIVNKIKMLGFTSDEADDKLGNKLEAYIRTSLPILGLKETTGSVVADDVNLLYESRFGKSITRKGRKKATFEEWELQKSRKLDIKQELYIERAIPNSFVYQPRGKQDSPDFYIFDEACELLQLEAKSGKAVMMNSGKFKEFCLYYIYFETGKTIVGYGKDILKDDVIPIQNQLRYQFDKYAAGFLSYLEANLPEEIMTAAKQYPELILYFRAMIRPIKQTSNMWSNK